MKNSFSLNDKKYFLDHFIPQDMRENVAKYFLDQISNLAQSTSSITMINRKQIIEIIGYYLDLKKRDVLFFRNSKNVQLKALAKMTDDR